MVGVLDHMPRKGLHFLFTPQLPVGGRGMTEHIGGFEAS